MTERTESTRCERSTVKEETEAMQAAWFAVESLDYDARGRVAAWLEMKVQSVREDAADAETTDKEDSWKKL